MSSRRGETARATGGVQGLRGPDVIVNTMFSLAVTAAGAAAFWPSYQSTQFLVLVGVTLVAGSALALIAARFRFSSATVTLLTVALIAVLGVPLAVPDAALFGVLPSWDGVLQLLAAIALAWKQLVTISLPVGSYEALLTPVFVLVLLSAVIGLTIALRSRRPSFAVVPGIVVFLAGVVFGPSIVERPMIPAAALFALVVGWLMWFTQRRRATQLRALGKKSRARRTRRAPALLVGAAVVAVAVAAGTAMTAIAPAAASRDVLRTRVHQPFDPRDYASPLSGFRNNFTAEHVDEEMLTVSGLGADRRIRVATLDTYNGVVYSVGTDRVSSASGSFTRVPYRFDQSDVVGTPARLEVAVSEYSGVWVPADGQLRDIEFTGERAQALRETLVYNDITGTIATTAGLARGDRYEVDVVIKPEVAADALANAQPGPATLPRLGAVPEQLDAAIEGYTKGVVGSGARLAAALKGLAREGYLSHGQPGEATSRSGHGEDRINELFAESPMVGDQEQYAVAAALMARRLGFPARVVVGYVAPAGAAGNTAPGGTVALTGADASAWIEVNTKADGWVTVDPNPAPRPVPETQRETETRVIRPQAVVDPPPDDDELRRDIAAQSDSEEPQEPDDPVWAIVFGVLVSVGVAVGVLALITAPFVAVLVAKARRRALRRKTPDPRNSVVAGWRELADTAADFGYELPPGATRSELALELGGMAPLVVATTADRAVFGTASPSGDDAERVWQTVLELRRSMADSRTRWQRWRAALSLRSLGWRRGGEASRYRGRVERPQEVS